MWVLWEGVGMSVSSALRPSFGVEDVEGVVAGGLCGAFQAGVVMQVWDYDLVLGLGAMVGAESYVAGWLVLLTLGVLLAVPFVGVVSGSTNAFTAKVIALSRRSELLQRVLVPLLKFSALGITCLALGQGYGLVVGLVVTLLVVPAWLTLAAGPAAVAPYLTLASLGSIVAWVVYGGTMGFVYGYWKEH